MASTYDLLQRMKDNYTGDWYYENQVPPSRGFVEQGRKGMPMDLQEAIFLGFMEHEIENNPKLLDHFENAEDLAKFVKDAETNRDYNIETGLDYAKTTGKGFWETLPRGIGYAIFDSLTNEDQDFWDKEGGIGDLIRNMKGVAMATDTNPLGLFYDELEKENVLGEYEYKMKNKKARGGIIDIL